VHLDTGSQGGRVQIWGTAGAERFLTLSPSFYRKSHGILLTYSISDRSSFSHIPKWEKSAKSHTPEAVFVLVGTKADLGREREVSYCEGAEWPLWRPLRGLGECGFGLCCTAVWGWTGGSVSECLRICTKIRKVP